MKLIKDIEARFGARPVQELAGRIGDPQLGAETITPAGVTASTLALAFRCNCFSFNRARADNLPAGKVDRKSSISDISLESLTMAHISEPIGRIGC